jgi:hypothetical protein
MKLIIPVESFVQNLGGVILYDPIKNKILKQYVHDKKWRRVGWRGGKVFGDYLIATDWQDLHYFNIKTWKYEKSFKKKTFNDLHYVEIHNNKLFIVNTGLDAIEIFKNPMNPKFEELIFLFDKNPKLFKRRALNRNETYNDKLKIKPHSAHPNCIAFDKNKIVVNCFGKEQRHHTGEVIELNSGKRIVQQNFDCHDGIFYNGDYYLTRTRYATILKINNLANREAPIKKIDEVFRIGKKGWWRGMVIHDDIAYVFASDGYKKKKTTAKIGIVNLKNGRRSASKIPSIDGACWDTIYQPNLYEE